MCVCVCVCVCLELEIKYAAIASLTRGLFLHIQSVLQRTTKNGLGNQLTVGTWSILKEEDDEEAMLGMMVDFGPIAVSIHASEEVNILALLF